ncbi:cytochrome B6 [Geobacter pelophilus]|uniref:Cytochrome B6 n=1 Tax=Geoanaerobacter pelophilus TaxID=60036 RepID=A0AAW4L4H2_9BACT|nr:selenite/tellurite reduction operon b-type cytochrome membrane protein ExtQ [Geoanaerobacter pelophilus]MBT0664430.1 cytochrome B6 [Geoanaerobacter pelophilus]
MNQPRSLKTDYLKSSPHFFQLIVVAACFLCLLLFCGAILIQAPLLGPADPGVPPNPAKSAWFLLWIQELVSHGTFLIYPVIILGCFFVILPWLPVYRPAWRASWLPEGQWFVNVLTVVSVAVIIGLTIIAAFFRGTQWQYAWPF